MVEITAIHTVVPRESTPNNPLELSPIDKKQRYHISTIFIYKQEKQNDMIEVPTQKMKESLSHLLVYYYPLAGRFHRIVGDELQVVCNAEGALLSEANSEMKLNDYGDFAPSELEDLVPNVDYSTPIEYWPLLLVQLTRFSCGGISVGLTICHNLVDGWSLCFFFNSWAKLFREQVLDEDEIPTYDRTILKPKFPVQRLNHDEFSAPPLLLGRYDTEEEKKNETTSMLLHLTKVQVEMLKKKANEVSDRSRRDHKHRPYSSFEVLAAHIWRSACKARQIGNDANQPTVVRMPVSIRDRVNPPVPRTYVGNAIIGTRTPICTFGDIISRPLCYSAQNIRQAVDRVTEERIRSAIDLFSANESDSPHLPRTGSTKAHFYGNPNLLISSMLNRPMYGADFGWGKPVHMGLTNIGTDGRTFILPARQGDGSANILICLQTRHAESFKKYIFQEVIQDQSRSSSTKGTTWQVRFDDQLNVQYPNKIATHI